MSAEHKLSVAAPPRSAEAPPTAMALLLLLVAAESLNVAVQGPVHAGLSLAALPNLNGRPREVKSHSLTADDKATYGNPG